jgi:low temperature requirement protein LtrA
MVGPLELFYDLAVVVLVAQAAHRLAGHLTWPGLGEFTVVFTLVWIAWANGSLHHELHGHKDARARSTFMLQILVLAAMGAFIPQAGGARGAAFAVASAVLFAILAVLWLLAARGDRPEYRRASRLFVTGTAATAVLLAGTALLPASARVPAWGLIDVAYLAGFAAVIATASPVQAARRLSPTRSPNGSGRSSSSCSAKPSPVWSPGCPASRSARSPWPWGWSPSWSASVPGGHTSTLPADAP